MKSEIHNLRNNKKIVQELGTKNKGLGQNLGSRVRHRVRNRNNNRNIKEHYEQKDNTSYTYMYENQEQYNNFD